MDSLNLLIDIFKNKGYKLTNQRKALLEVLYENDGNVLSVEDLYSKTKSKCSQTNLSTIYRNLEILEEINLVHKTLIDNTTAFYKLKCEDSHHHHLICKGCGKTEAIDFCPFKDFKNNIPNNNFKITEHKFELFGYCKIV
ncbi:hypothetical protein Q428_14085 [Fervidicella metallireducens AeB]|uniref:Fur family transcriptional regulator n=1 Tax=Fervidicella metallireducens AeB TaxID=1403537 RepID=A0A017RRK9_9CLOT|nr:transcriptional repressor [Fervidicella metallireducens]EYE87292.1 hypothetical protein Q428_14085 [Fervidicella metallireducens AeB]